VPQREPISQTVRISSVAALAGLVPHYLLFYTAGTPLWTDQIAEWIMARTPSPYAVAILEDLGSWAKPWANTGGLAALGFVLFLARFAGRAAGARRRSSLLTAATGVCAACALAWWCGYSSALGSISFWTPALGIAALVPFTAPHSAVHLPERRTLLGDAARFGLPLVMGSGVIAVAAESFFRDGALARRASEPVTLFPFSPPQDREAFAPGLVRKAVTPTREFYGMSKNTVDPVIDSRTWRLNVTVDGRPVHRYSYGELLGLERQRRYVTLRCISNTLKSDLMGTAEWAGIHLSQLMGRNALPPGMAEVAFIGAEGHDDSLRIDYAYSDEAMLALGMNGKTLSRTHGFPVRLLAARYYGCRNVKWLREIRFVSRPYYGTWQRLGYTNEPIIHIASHIDHLKRDGELLQLGGVSFAGTRGIRAVRVRSNRGAWQPARTEPPLSSYTWTRWVAQINAPQGALIEANAQDGSGNWQQLSEGDPFPNGPSGPTVIIARL
jgi:DMSO/TMAO reductase YedYZ molybdopterin-dependent catalytic subunit